MDYNEFLHSKIEIAPESGFDVKPEEVNPALKPHQRDAVIWACKGGRRALFESFGLGKCHGKGTEILMSDCSLKKVEDVQVGDSLMGDDGKPRLVLSLARGTDKMYKVTLKNGDSFTCNESHILSCEISNKYRVHETGEVVNIAVKEFLQLPEYAKRNCFKAYKRPLDFPQKAVPFDPYVYGLWLGDGSRNNLSFTINDRDNEIVDYLNEWAKEHGFVCRMETGEGCKTYHYSKGARNEREYFEKDFVKKSYLSEKRIYKDYIVNSREIRLQVLAGILDTDGHLIDNCYEIVTKFAGLRDDILFLCRSLGLSVTHVVKTVNSTNYYRIYISGNTGEIPCLTRKKAGRRKQIKNPLRYGFSVEYIGIGEYYGFTIDGNHLYMLGDFTVTHNTVQELEFCRLAVKHGGGRALIVLPLGVRQEFTRDASELLHMEPPVYVRNMEEAMKAPGNILMTNYERVRDGDIDPRKFTATSLDEASVLRSYGSKTFQTFMELFKGVKYKLVATATPSPNRYKELIHYSGYLEVMDTGQALTRFFQRDSTKANNLTLYPHKEEEFWLWVSSWALFLSSPSDLGYDDTGYNLPPLDVRTHMIKSQIGGVFDKDGQEKMMRDAAVNLMDAAREKRESVLERVDVAKSIVDSDPDANFILWHDLEYERETILKKIPGSVDIHGSMDYEEREKRVVDFSEGRTRLFATKKSLSGSGCNFQKHCHRAIFIGIDYEFNDFIQAIHRIYRFLQTERVIIDVIYTEAEEQIWRVLMEKWNNHKKLQENMRRIVMKHGLLAERQAERMARSIGVNRVEQKGESWVLVNNDCVEEVKGMQDNSIDLIHSSIPFSNHYEYTASYNDFGHNENTQRFFQQMDYLTPELLRILKPGRVAAIHVKDRVLFGSVTGTGMPTMEPFHAMCIQHYMKHGFAYFGMITVVTDVVRENNQTYRLSWTEQCKDGTKMGVGCPEYILLFRKLPTDRSKAYADERVVKDKRDYPLSRWQLDAHAFWRSSGDRNLVPSELARMKMSDKMRVFREYSKSHVYDYDEHVALGYALEQVDGISKEFMTLPPASTSEDVWDDINRMKTLNTKQSQKRKQLHVCPLQLDIVERIIERYSNPGDLVFDPFSGLATVPMMAVRMGRKGYGCELNPDYYADGVGYLRAEEAKVEQPSLFDVLEQDKN